MTYTQDNAPVLAAHSPKLIQNITPISPVMKEEEMHVHRCPICDYRFVSRKGRRCRKCDTLIIHPKELYWAEDPRNESGIFLCDKKENLYLLKINESGETTYEPIKTKETRETFSTSLICVYDGHDDCKFKNCNCTCHRDN